MTTASTTCMSWCSSSSWSRTSAARSRRSATRRCFSAFSRAWISSGRRSICFPRRCSRSASSWRCSSCWTRSSTGAKATCRPDPTPDQPIRVTGGINMLLGGVIIVAILLSAKLQLGTFTVLGTEVAVQNLLRDAVMVAVTLVSFSPRRSRAIEANGFSWGPDRGSRGAVRRHLRHDHSGAGDAARRQCRRLRAAGGHGDQCRRQREQRRLFLADRRPLVLPGQRPDLSRLLRAGGRPRRSS